MSKAHMGSRGSMLRQGQLTGAWHEWNRRVVVKVCGRAMLQFCKLSSHCLAVSTYVGGLTVYEQVCGVRGKGVGEPVVCYGTEREKEGGGGVGRGVPQGHTGTRRCLLQVVVRRLQDVLIREGVQALSLLASNVEQVLRRRLPPPLERRGRASTLQQDSTMNAVHCKGEALPPVLELLLEEVSRRGGVIRKIQ